MVGFREERLEHALQVEVAVEATQVTSVLLEHSDLGYLVEISKSLDFLAVDAIFDEGEDGLFVLIVVFGCQVRHQEVELVDFVLNFAIQ
jgi:hypothetical protein